MSDKSPASASSSSGESRKSLDSDMYYEDERGDIVPVVFGSAYGPGQYTGTICEDEDGELVGNLGAMADYERTEWHIINMHTPNIIWWGEGPDADGGTIYVDENDVITDPDGEQVLDVNTYVREHHVVRIIHEYRDFQGEEVSEGNEDWIPKRERREEAGLSVSSEESSHNGSDEQEHEEEKEEDEEDEGEEENGEEIEIDREEKSTHSNRDNDNLKSDDDSLSQPSRTPSISSRHRAPQPLSLVLNRSRRVAQRRRSLNAQPAPVRSGDPHFADRAYRPTTRPRQAGLATTRPRRTRRAPERYGFEDDVFEARVI
ncbi:hypothetical protein MMC17_008173 [Xylographa soralifera]|nr:hypothetical protein [Xylographa soralifera]